MRIKRKDETKAVVFKMSLDEYIALRECAEIVLNSIESGVPVVELREGAIENVCLDILGR
mgnify:CR=1 FL=1